MLLHSESGETIETPSIVTALKTIVDRHPALRTTFHQTHSAGKPRLVQQIHALEHFDICSVQNINTHLPRGEHALSTHLLANQNLQSAIERPFNLRSQVFRFTVFQLLDGHVLVLMMFHHISFDGASLHIIAKELLLLLNGESLPEAACSFHTGCGNISAGESLPREISSLDPDRGLDSVKQSVQVQSWVSVLKSAVHCTRISPMNVRMCASAIRETSAGIPSSPGNSHLAVQQYLDDRECGYLYLEAPPHTATAIQSLARSWNISPTLVITSAFALTLHKCTGNSDIIFGVMSLGRDHHTQNTVGYFANQLPFRVNFSPKSFHASTESAIDDLLSQVKKNWQLILEGGVELQDLVSHIPCLQRKTNSLATPLQVVFSYYKVSNQKLLTALTMDGKKVQCDISVPRSGHTHIDLFCEAQPKKVKGKATQYTFFWEFRKSVLDSGEVKQLQDLMCRLIDTLAKNGAIRDITLPQRGDMHKSVSIVPMANSSNEINTPSEGGNIKDEPSMANGSNEMPNNGSVKDELSVWPMANDSFEIHTLPKNGSIRGTMSVPPMANGSHEPTKKSSCPPEESPRLSLAVGPSMSEDAAKFVPYIVRFEDKCREIPDSPAFRYEGEELTYSRAHLLVSKLAVVLTEKGIALGDHVALYMRRTPWLFLAILAVLKCGAAYVPIALQNPAERIAVILRLAECNLLFTEKDLLKSIPQHSGVTLCLEEAQLLLRDVDVASLPSRVYEPDHLFYIVFSSGTTGAPKGVGITHGNMHATIANFQSLISRKDSAVTLASISISFDPHVIDSLAPLLNGACIVVVESILSNIDDDITYCVATPSAASVVTFPASMRAIIVGGEAFTITCYLNTRHIPKVYNCYGPSECTIFVTAQRVLCEEDSRSIGRPVSRVKALVLDDSQQLLPVGETGILHIAGATVSSAGYYNNPKKTRQVFFPSPFNSSDVLYCTGDLVRMLSDGRLQFLGRKDNQVKLRGMRFQLLEVESTLALHPDITSAAAMVVDKGTADAKLIAFVTPQLVTADSVRHFLASKLPAFMVPSVIRPLAELPLSKEGKVDRRALAALPQTLALKQIRGTSTAPSGTGETEAQVVGIFAQVLGISDDFPASADFFALGGQSLQTFQLVNLIQQGLGCQLTVADILQHSTPASLTEVIKLSRLSSPPLPRVTNISLQNPHPTPHTQCAKSKKLVPCQKKGPKSSRNIDWSSFSFISPVPDITLSPQLLANLQSISQKDATMTQAFELTVLSEELRKESGIELHPSSLTQYASMRILQSHLKLKMVLMFESTAVTPLVQLHRPRSPEELPIFFVHAGIIGWPLPYMKLAKSLGRYSFAVQRSKDAPASTFGELAAYYISAIRAVQPHGPYHFVGVCYGAALVYEMSTQLHAKGESVDLAVLIGGSPVNEGRPEIFDGNGRPLPNHPAHPVHFLQSCLQLSLPTDSLTELNTTDVTIETVSLAMLSAHPWVPFTSEQLQNLYDGYLNTLRALWFNYTTGLGALIKKCLLIRGQHHPFYRSHDYGLLALLAPSSSLSVLVPPRKLGLLVEQDTLDFVTSAINLFL